VPPGRRTSPGKLDPTYLEQTGLDSKQVQKEVEAAVKQAVAQAQSTTSATGTSSSAGSSQPSTGSSSSSSSGYRPADYLLNQQSASSAASPSSGSSSSSSSAGRGPSADALYNQYVQKTQTTSSSTPSPPSNTSAPGGDDRKPSLKDIIHKLDPTTADPSSVQSVLDAQKSQQLKVWTSGGGSSGGGRDYTKGRGLWGASAGGGSPAGSSPPPPQPPPLLQNSLLQKHLGGFSLLNLANNNTASSGQPPGGGQPPLSPPPWSNLLGGYGLLNVATPPNNTAPGSSPSGGASTGGGAPNPGGRPIYDRRRGLPSSSGASGSGQPPGGGQPPGVGAVSPDYLLNQRSPENIVNSLTAAYEDLKNKLIQTVSSYSNVLTYSGNKIDMSPQLQGLVNRYEQALNELKDVPDLTSLLMQQLGDKVLVVDEGEGPPDYQLTPGDLKNILKNKDKKNAKVIVIRGPSGVDIKLAPDVEKAVQEVDKLNRELFNAERDYWRKIYDVADRFNASNGKFKIDIKDGKLVIDTSVHEEGFNKVRQLNNEYQNKLDALIKQYGGVVEVGEDGKPVIVFTDPSKYNEFKAKLGDLNKWYDAALNSILKEHGLTVEDGKIVIDKSIYSDVFSEIDKINQEYENKRKDIYGRYSHLLVTQIDEKGNTVYTLRPDVKSAVDIYNQVANVVNTYSAAVKQKVEEVANKYSDVVTYDPKTGKVGPSSELAAMYDRYKQAVQEVSNIINAMNTVAGMIPTFAQQLPVFKVTFQTYDKSQNKFVKTGGETPIYIKDKNLRKEIMDWMSQNKDNVAVVALYDPNSRGRPYVVYVFNKDTKEGYVIDPIEGTGFHVKGTEVGMVYNPATGKWEQLRGIDIYLREKTLDIWNKSLTDVEREILDTKRQTKEWLLSLPPVVRDIAGGALALSQYAVIAPAVDVVVRTLMGDEDPLRDIKKLQAMLEAVKEVTPVAYDIATVGGAAAMLGLGAESLLARGAAKLGTQAAKEAAKDITKFAIVKKPEIPITGPIQLLDTAKTPTFLQTLLAGLKDAAVPMAVGGAAFGGLEAVKSYLETGKVDIPRVLTSAAFGSLMGALPITKTQALAALGAGAGAALGSSLLRGYDLPTSLAVGESAGTLVLVVPGLRGLSDAGAKTLDVKAPEVKITDFAAVVKPEGRTPPRVDLSAVDLSKKLSSAVGNVVADVVSGRISIEEANLRLGAIRDAVTDKALFDKILQIYKTIKEHPKAPSLEFAEAAKNAAEVVSAVEAGKLPEHRAFIELADLRASVADKARFDSLFGANLREYGEQYVSWLLNSGLDKPSAALQLAKYEDVLGRQFIEKYMPDYGKVLAEVEERLAQLRPVSPRKAPSFRPTPEELHGRVRTLFEDVLAGRMDWFKASEELYRLWSSLSPDMRPELEAVLNQLNRVYGERYGLTLEPWRPSLLESVLRRAELFAADVRSALANAPKATAEAIRGAVKAAEDWWRRMRIGALDEELRGIADSFSRGKIGLDEAKKALGELAGRYEELGMEEMAGVIRNSLKDDEALRRFLDAARTWRSGSKLEWTLELAKSRIGDAVETAVSALKELVPEHRRYTRKGWRFIEAEDKLRNIIDRFRRGEIDLETARREVSKIAEEIEKAFGRELAEMYMRQFELLALDAEFGRIISRFRRGEISAEEARRRLMEVADEIEKKVGKERADFYRQYAEEVLTGKRAEPARVEKKPRLPDEKEAEWIRRAEEEERRLRLERKQKEGREREKGSGRGQQLLLLEAGKEAALKAEEVARKMERSLRRIRFAGLYDELIKTLDAYSRGEIDVDTAKRLIADIVKKMEDVERDIKAKIKAEAQRPVLLGEVKELAARVGDSAVRIELTLRYGRMRALLNDLLNVLDAYRRGEVSPDAARQQIAHIIRNIEKADRDIAEILRDKVPDAVRPAEVRQVLTPEVRSALLEGLEERQRLGESDATLTSPMTAVAAATRLRKPTVLYVVRELELEPPEKRRRPIIPVVPQIPTETPHLAPPSVTPDTLRTEGVPEYNPPLLATTTPPPTADVPPPPTYTPTVPQISEVPPLYVPTTPPPGEVPNVPPLYVPTTPPPGEVPNVPPPEEPPRLPPGWWRLLPPDAVMNDSREGAYKVQAGKRQILVLA